MALRTIKAERCGPIAREILDDEGEVRVLAAFDRCIYLACPHGIVCIGSGIGGGPINVELLSTSVIDWLAFGIGPGVEGALRHGRADVGSLKLDAVNAAHWQAPSVPAFDSAICGSAAVIPPPPVSALSGAEP